MGQDTMNLDDAFDLAMFDALANPAPEPKGKSSPKPARKPFHARPESFSLNSSLTPTSTLSESHEPEQRPPLPRSSKPKRATRSEVKESYPVEFAPSRAILFLLKLVIALALVAVGAWAIQGVGLQPH
ncbi:MAG: hypothetical protein Q4G68_04855 [Planctomycetia bacterium]|nr:hypothetical protein [Planctomycetia bacterium]